MKTGVKHISLCINNALFFLSLFFTLAVKSGRFPSELRYRLERITSLESLDTLRAAVDSSVCCLYHRHCAVDFCFPDGQQTPRTKATHYY